MAEQKKRKSQVPKTSLDKIIKSLKKRGATRGKVIDVQDIIVDERVRLKCQVPLCNSFNRNLMCPPRLPSLTEFREALARFSKAILIQVSGELKKPNDAFRYAKNLHGLVHAGEKEAFEVGFPFAAGFIGGCCRLCKTCVAAEYHDPPMACRFPFKARPSMEAMGIDVVATVAAAGWPSEFPVTNKVIWTGLILVF